MIIFTAIPCLWHYNSDWLPQCPRLLLSGLLFISIWIWGVFFWTFRLFRDLWELNFLFLSLYRTVWRSTLRFILHLWLFLQHWFFVKNHISTGKGVRFLGIPKSKTLDSFGEPDEDILLRLGLQFVPFLTINQTICWANRKSIRLNSLQTLLTISPLGSEDQ